MASAWRSLLGGSAVSNSTTAADLVTGRKLLAQIQVALADAFQQQKDARALSVDEIAPIKALCDQLLPAHFQLAVPIAGSAAITHRKARHVRYQHIWEDDKFSMGIFILPPGASIPLHDHPEMTVISRVLYGNLHVKACDLVPEKDAGALVRENFSSKSPSESLRLARMCTNQEIAAPYTTELLPDRGNLHEFVAGDGVGCAIFDILTPPYEPDEGRDCTYYRFVGPATHDAASGDEFVALEEFDPVEFEVHSEPYRGPVLMLSTPMSTASSSSSVSSGGTRSPSSSSP
uniref:Cysteine dioxygenase n=1 Tax=Globisporangium ultimum (strain ATCC 200006 / CBS 805.95 / DAOM BR144) TaxID=431595 RepID=K3W9Z9_GLOUD